MQHKKMPIYAMQTKHYCATQDKTVVGNTRQDMAMQHKTKYDCATQDKHVLPTHYNK